MPNPFASIKGCTDVITSPAATPANKFTAYLVRGIGYRFTHHPDLALADANSAIALDPGNYAGYAQRALDYVAQGKFDPAIADDSKAISLDPYNGGLYYERSIAYQAKGESTQALSDLNTAVTLNPQDTRALFNRALIYDNLGQWNNVISDTSTVILLAPKFEPARELRGEAYLMAGDYQQSVADEAQAVKLGPLDAVAWNNLCYGQAIIGKLNDALGNCNNAILLGLGSANEEIFINSRAYVYLQMKNYPLAIADYKQTLKMTPNDTDSLYGLSLAEKASGDAAASAADFAAAKRLNPNIVEEFAHHDVP